MTEYELLIEKFDHEGRGIGYINEKVIFVDNTIPGDKVLITLEKNKKKYAIGKIKKILEYSSNRIDAKCPYFDKCGGCDLQNIDYSNQLKFKEEKVKNILNRFSSISNDKIKSIVSDNRQFNYRNKITFQVKKQIGLFGKNSYDLVSIDKCYLVPDEINKVLEKIKKNIVLDNIKQIVIRYSFYSKNTMIIFIGDSIDKNNIIKSGLLVSSIYIKNKNYELIYGDEYLEEKLGDYIFKISPDSFFQVNTNMCVKLYDKIIEYGNFSGNENVLDLYCGTGTIGIYISRFVKSIVGYEINEYAVKDAKINKKNNKVDNIYFYCGSSELSFENITDIIDTIIVDPPRSGLNERTIMGIVNVKPCKVIYVSCDTITLARDLKILSEYYSLVEVTPFDMFPNTKHVECVSLLCLKENYKIK